MCSARPASYSEETSTAQATPISSVYYGAANGTTVVINDALFPPQTTPVIVGNYTTTAAKRRSSSCIVEFCMYPLLIFSFLVPVWFLGYNQWPLLRYLAASKTSNSTNSTQLYMSSVNTTTETLMPSASMWSSEYASLDPAMASIMVPKEPMTLIAEATSVKETNTPKVTNEVVIGT